MKSLIRKNGWLMVILVFLFLLKIPSLFDPFTYGDEGIYMTLGLAARRGLTWYRDIHDNKPPLLYLIAALSNNFFTYRLIHFAWSLVTVFVFWLLAGLLFSKKRRSQNLATLAFTILTSIPLFEGNIGNAENFMMLPMIAGFYLLYEILICNHQRPVSKPRAGCMPRLLQAEIFGNRHTGVIFTGIGFLFGLATLFKVPAAFDFAAVLFFVFLALPKERSGKFRFLVPRFLFLVGGFFFPIAASIAYYFTKGAGSEYLLAAFAQNLPYLSSWQSGSHQTMGFPSALFFRFWVTMAVVTGLFLLRKKVLPATRLILTWFIFSWFASLLSSRPYPHYLLQPMPPFCLSVGLVAMKNAGKIEKKLPVILGAVTLLTFLGFGFWQYKTIDYYQRFYGHLVKKQSLADYWRDFDRSAVSIYETSDYLRSRTFPEEKIFIWGTLPSIYALSERLPTGRYTALYHVIDFQGQRETIEAILKEPPRYFLVNTNERPPFPELGAVIQNNYALERTIGSVKIYHRLN